MCPPTVCIAGERGYKKESGNFKWAESNLNRKKQIEVWWQEEKLLSKWHWGVLGELRILCVNMWAENKKDTLLVFSLETAIKYPNFF